MCSPCVCAVWLAPDALPASSATPGPSSNATAAPPNFVAIIGEERREWHLEPSTARRMTTADPPVRPSGRFNGLGDFFEGSGYKFASWGDVGRAHSEALEAVMGRQWVEDDAATVQAHNQIKVKNTSPRTCLVANLQPQAPGKGSAGHLELSKELAGGESPCRALDYESSASTPSSTFSGLAVYDEAVAKLDKGDFDDPVRGEAEPSAPGRDAGPLPVTSYLLQARLSLACRPDKPTQKACAPPNLLKWVLLDVLDLPSNAAVSVSAPLHEVPSSLAATIANHTGTDLAEHMAQSLDGEQHVVTDSNGRRERRRLGEACGSGTGALLSAYDVRVVAQSAEVADSVRDTLASLSEGSASELTLVLQDVLAEAKDTTQVCGAGVRVTADVAVPSEPQPWRPSASSSMAPSLSLGDGRSPTPPSSLSVKRAYSVFVSNFPEGHDLVVKLIRGTDSTGPIVLNLAKFKDKGYAEAKWTVEEAALPTEGSKGDSFYLYAFSKALPALFATTTPFTITRTH